MFDQVAQKIEDLFYPELRAYERADRARMLRKASETPLDLIEWTGIIFGLVIVASVTRYGAQSFGIIDRLALALVNLAIAVPLLGLMVGPFLYRRQKRGLREQLR